MLYKKYKIKYIISLLLVIFLVVFFQAGILGRTGKNSLVKEMFDGFYYRCFLPTPVSSNMRSNKSGQRLFFEKESVSTTIGGDLISSVKSRYGNDILNTNKLYFINLLFITSYVLHFIMKYINKADGKK